MLKNNEVRLNKLVKNIKRNASSMKLHKNGLKYDLFPSNQKYKEYTNIDISFLIKLSSIIY